MPQIKTARLLFTDANAVMPLPQDVVTLKRKLGGTVRGKQIDHEPDLRAILDLGEFIAPKGMRRVRSHDGCHWNVAKLYQRGMLDGIVIGFAQQKTNEWWQHSWGWSAGKVVETMACYYHVVSYYGWKLSPAQSDEFANFVWDEDDGFSTCDPVRFTTQEEEWC